MEPICVHSVVVVPRHLAMYWMCIANCLGEYISNNGWTELFISLWNYCRTFLSYIYYPYL